MNLEIIHQRILSISDDIRRLADVLHDMGELDMPRFFEKYGELSVEAARRSEWITLRLRHLIYGGTCIRKHDYLPQAVDTQGIRIQQSEGMYEITLPGLMPKRKARQGAEFLFDPLMFALEQYVSGNRIVRFPHCTVCFLLVYDRTLPTRRIRDYDNLELKYALDAAASYLMYSDTGLLCDAYQTTELGETDCTKMFIMDTRHFPAWYAQRQEILQSEETPVLKGR